jgi:tRNA(Leu) C34 or U34 (ribose-2'-O)-methylase TrmL
MTIRNKDGSFTTYLAEIKPAQFTVAPKQPKRKTKRYIEEAMMYCTNTAKWEAARAFCARKGYKFIILTEKELGIK